MRLVFLGSPAEVVTPLKWIYEHANAAGHELVGVVSQPPRPAGRGRQLQQPPIAEVAQQLNLPLLQPERASSSDFLHTFATWQPDIAITAAYGQILTDDFLKIPKRATINIHPSLLPKYRGAIPVPASLLAGDRETGVTVLFTVKALDAGSIIVQKAFSIEDRETADVLTQRLFAASGTLVMDAIELLRNPNFVGRAQDASMVSHCRKISKVDGLIDWTMSAKEITQRYRAYFPWPGIYTFFNNQRLSLSDIEESNSLSQLESEPGSLCYDAARKCLVVRCGTGVLAIRRLQKEGSKATDAQSFWNGTKNRDGLRFEAK